MNSEQKQFERMLSALIGFVDAVNESHSQGMDFGTAARLFPAEMHTIAAIAVDPGINLTRLAKTLGIAKPTLSERIQKLINKGFVKKAKAPENQKAVTLWLTENGEKANHAHSLHHNRMYEFFRCQFGEETPQKIELFTRTFQELTQLGKNMDKHR